MKPRNFDYRVEDNKRSIDMMMDVVSSHESQIKAILDFFNLEIVDVPAVPKKAICVKKEESNQ